MVSRSQILYFLLSGLGGSIGYLIGGIEWETLVPILEELLGSHVRIVFTIVLVLFVISVSLTVTSFREMPLELIHPRSSRMEYTQFMDNGESFELNSVASKYSAVTKRYGRFAFATYRSTRTAE